MKGNPITFLDNAIKTVSKNVDCWWFTKAVRSNNSLRKDTWVHNFVTDSFLRNSLDKVSSSEHLYVKSIDKLNKKLRKMVLIK